MGMTQRYGQSVTLVFGKRLVDTQYDSNHMSYLTLFCSSSTDHRLFDQARCIFSNG